MLMKDYQPSAIEKKWRDRWHLNGVNKAEENSSRSKFYCLDMFPYPSGNGLHVGHWRGYVLSDVISRYKKLQGFNVLHPMGWDAFGLPAENDAIKKGIPPLLSTRKNSANFRRQLEEMGAMYDWEREINTSDPDFYRFTQWIFLKMHEKGLAYRKEMPINWCPGCKTGLANEEVVNGKCDRCDTTIVKKPMMQWMLKITDYADRLLEDLNGLVWPEKVKKMQANWIGRSVGTEIRFQAENFEEAITVFTTKPERLSLACSIALAPEHPLAQALVVPENRAASEDYITQALQKSNVERLKQGGDPEQVQVSCTKTGFCTGSRAVNPLTGQAIPILIWDGVLPEWGTGALLVYSENEMDKTEPLPPQAPWAKPAVHYKLRDWVFSRQRYWGEPIPIIHCPECGEVPVKEEELPVLLPEVRSYAPSGTGESPLAAMGEWVNIPCPKCGKPAKRETNTMPQWAGSSWYFLRFCDPFNTEALFSREKACYWLPVDFYTGGVEHAVLHLLYARFYTKFLFDIGIVDFNEPFTHLFNQGMILKNGFKMGKSKGNAVSPDAIVSRFGADALRLYEMFIGPPELDAEWSDAGIEGVHRFLKRVWGIARISIKSPPAPSKAINAKTNLLIKETEQRLSGKKINTVASLFMSYVNDLHRESPQGLDRANLEKFIILLAPFVPYLAEEVWEALGHKKSVFASSRWPQYNSRLAQEPEREIPVQVNGKVRAVITVTERLNQEEAIHKAMTLDGVKCLLEGKRVVKTVYVPGKILSFVVEDKAFVAEEKAEDS